MAYEKREIQWNKNEHSKINITGNIINVEMTQNILINRNQSRKLIVNMNKMMKESRDMRYCE